MTDSDNAPVTDTLLDRWRSGEFENGADAEAQDKADAMSNGELVDASLIIEAWLTALPEADLSSGGVRVPEKWMLEPAAIYLEMVEDDDTGSNVVVAKFLRDLASSAIEPTQAPQGDGAWGECATEGCNRLATVRFERHGVGSGYCPECYIKVQEVSYRQPTQAPSDGVDERGVRIHPLMACGECGNPVRPEDETVIGDVPMHKACADTWAERNADAIAGKLDPAPAELEVVAFVSPDQLSEHKDPLDPDHMGGDYLPVRKTNAGKFTEALVRLTDALTALRAERERLEGGIEEWEDLAINRGMDRRKMYERAKAAESRVADLADAMNVIANGAVNPSALARAALLEEEGGK